MNKIKILKCNRCLHEWASKMKIPPKFCPKCKTPYWNKKKIKIK